MIEANRLPFAKLPIDCSSSFTEQHLDPHHRPARKPCSWSGRSWPALVALVASLTCAALALGLLASDGAPREVRAEALLVRNTVLKPKRATPLTLLPDDSPGRCMDGTPGGFYFSKAVSNATRLKWVLFLESGGECTNEDECRRRAYARPQLVSSKAFTATWVDEGSEWNNLASGNSSVNPGLFEWNRVKFKYCSQDLWSGTRTERSAETSHYYFSGHIIFKEIVGRLTESAGLGGATDVILAGSSAGGIGTWLNVGWLKSALPAARVTLVSVAGFYGYSYPYLGPGHMKMALADFGPGEAAWPRYYKLWRSFVDPACAAALKDAPWQCLLANVSRPHINVSAFVAEALTDRVQLSGHCNIPPCKPTAPGVSEQFAYIAAWRRNMTGMLEGRLRSSDGLFSPACYIHTSFFSTGPFLADEAGRNLTFTKAFVRWYDGARVRLQDRCHGLSCGSCGNSEAFCNTTFVL